MMNTLWNIHHDMAIGRVAAASSVKLIPCHPDIPAEPLLVIILVRASNVECILCPSSHHSYAAAVSEFPSIKHTKASSARVRSHQDNL